VNGVEHLHYSICLAIFTSSPVAPIYIFIIPSFTTSSSPPVAPIYIFMIFIPSFRQAPASPLCLTFKFVSIYFSSFNSIYFSFIFPSPPLSFDYATFAHLFHF
jgi:hypothetical protein